MPPKVRITKEDILNKAVDIVRKEGEGALNARMLAKALNCSTQPIFSNYATMEELRLDVIAYADRIYQGYITRETESGLYLPYKAQGMGYISFAKEEKELFKLLYMRNRSEETDDDKAILPIIKMLREYLSISEERARLFHLEMWVFVHGIAVISAGSYLELEKDLVSEMLTDCFEGLKHRFGVKP